MFKVLVADNRAKTIIFLRGGGVFHCRNLNHDNALTDFKQIFLTHQFHTGVLLYCQNYTPSET